MRIHRHILTGAAALTLGALSVGTAAAAGPAGSPPPPPKGSAAQHPAGPAAKGASGRSASSLAAAGLAPPNDSFAAAQFLPSANNSVSGSNAGATVESGEPSHGDQLNPASNSVWYTWTAPATGRAIFRTIGSNFDTVMAAYLPGPATGVGGLTQIAANDDLVLDNSTTASQIKFTVTAGQRYFIAVDGFGQATGAIKLTWTTNDDFEAAQVLTGPAEGSFATFAVHNEGAGPELTEPRHNGKVTGTSVWYRWTAPFDGNASFETTQNNYDTVLAVYTGERIDQLTEVTSNDDLAPGVLRSRVVFAARAGQTYRIALAGLNGQSGFEVVNYTLIRRTITAGTASAAEGPAGTTRTVNLPVTLSTPHPGAVRVHFATIDGSAKAGSDYLATSGDLTFAAGQTTRSVPVIVKGDAVKEPAETFGLQLSAPTSGFTLKASRGTGTITNDD